MKAVPIVGERGQDFTAADFSDAHTPPSGAGQLLLLSGRAMCSLPAIRTDTAWGCEAFILTTEFWHEYSTSLARGDYRRRHQRHGRSDAVG